ncbi:MAG: hypothetical protein ACP5N7_04065 [Candidatus Pacearchaeota archaeon]
MNLKRGILISLALYASTMVVGIIMTIIANLNMQSTQNIPTTYWIITIITTVLLTCLASIWYFAKAKRSPKEGLKLGVTFILVGFVLDLIFFFSQENAAQIMKDYYSSISFYLVLALVVASAFFIGSRSHKQQKEEIKKVSKKRK